MQLKQSFQLYLMAQRGGETAARPQQCPGSEYVRGEGCGGASRLIEGDEPAG